MKLLAGAWAGAMLVLAVCIAYDTSSNVSVLEGAHGHLTFRAIVVLAALGGLIGSLAVGLLGRSSAGPTKNPFRE